MCTCSYCGSQLINYDNKLSCSFCNATYDESESFGPISLDYKRTQKIPFKGFVTIEDISLSITELEKLHTIDLLLGLRLARAERTQTYYLVRVINNAADQMTAGTIEQLDTDTESKEAGDMYMLWTRRMWVIENLLIDRMGFFPERITDDFIDRMIKQYKRSISKPMRINSKRQSNFIPKEQNVSK